MKVFGVTETTRKCFLEKCKTCREYSSCPLLSGTLQRSYANRTLDSIFKTLTKIEDVIRKGNKRIEKV